MFRWPLRDSHELCQDLMKSKPEPAVVMSAEINISKTMNSWTMPHVGMALLGVILDLMQAGF